MYLEINLQYYTNFIQIFPVILIILCIEKENSGSQVPVICHVSLMSLTYLRRTGPLFIDCPTNQFCLVLSLCQVQGRHLGQVHEMSGAVSSVCHMRRLSWSITGDVNSDRLGKVMSAMFLHCNITIPPLVICKYLMGRSYFGAVLFY